MASESREEQALGADVPADLQEWLDERAASLGVEREELVVQVLSAYQASATMDGQLDAAGLLDLDAEDFVDVEAAVDDAVDEAVADAAATAVDDRERLVDELTETITETAASDRRSALADLDAEFQAKIEDVRERVVQVKREADAKAPADHDHQEFEAIEAIDGRVDDLAGDLEALRERVGDGDEDDELPGRIDDVEEKLNRVAWVVSDLKDEATGRDAHEQAVDRIKRAAAQEGIATADCERCGEAVHVALLTDPECPHCNAAVSDVRPVGGFLRTKARLVPASQLESGDSDR